MNDNMVISQNGVELIKQFEGLRLTAYKDSVGVWTIGYGHTKGVYGGMVISNQQALNFLDEDIANHVWRMKQLITRKLTQNQFDSLASFHFNLGAYVLDNDPTLLRHINNNDTNAVVNHMLKYSYAGGMWLQGLYNRRVAETNLYKKESNTNETIKGGKIKMKSFTLTNDVWLRKGASTSSQAIGSQPLKKGSVVNFDDVTVSGGYMWGIQPRADGSKGYIALGAFNGYGTIK